MIYVLISGGKTRTKTEKTEKRDCRILQQPLSLLPKETKEYIENTKNEKVSLERRLAYTSLFLGLREFFGIENAEVRRTEYGKPFLVIEGIEVINQKNTNSAQKNKYQKNEDFELLLSNDHTAKISDYRSDFVSGDSPSLLYSDECSGKMKKIYVSISHSEGVSAVCLSDEGEVGIDIQAEIDFLKAGKLNGRFFPAIKPFHTELGVKYCLCDISNESAYVESAELACADVNSETVKWALCESLIKLSGGGFGDLKRIEYTSEHSFTELKTFTDESKFFVAVSTTK